MLKKHFTLVCVKRMWDTFFRWQKNGGCFAVCEARIKRKKIRSILAEFAFPGKKITAKDLINFDEFIFSMSAMKNVLVVTLSGAHPQFLVHYTLLERTSYGYFSIQPWNKWNSSSLFFAYYLPGALSSRLALIAAVFSTAGFCQDHLSFSKSLGRKVFFYFCI